jgi:GGDEF domain-containing protein
LLDDALHAMALAEKRLFGVQRENIGLRKDNAHLMEALDGASRHAVAAVRVAQHDGLTGLSNRLLPIKRLQRTVWHAAERRGQLALVFNDLDGFKTVNDRLLQHADAAIFHDKAIRCAKDGLCEMAGDAGAANQEQPTETRAAG